ncbi:MAG TPA: 6,7-dimethyl-8-ribityllumazine synthase, partial [Longimicrobiales bacterium]|nr:6,7-dimethyl-8-ribityllumazine synthase [Longimicrobiales bacterium]
MTEFSGRARAHGAKVGIAVSRFNDLITERLLAGAKSCLMEHGVPEGEIDVAWVPGAWELPLAARKLIEKRGCSAVVALGCVVRGDTPHFDFVAGAAATGLINVSTEKGVPVAFGVLTTDTMEQALARAGGKAGNKGWESALAVLEQLDLIAEMESADG